MYETKGTGSGCVVGEYLCRGHIKTNVFSPAPEFTQQKEIADYQDYIAERSCLTLSELLTYANCGSIYGLDVSEPIKYEFPRLLSAFGLGQAPQSWQYVIKKK